MSYVSCMVINKIVMLRNFFKSFFMEDYTLNLEAPWDEVKEMLEEIKSEAVRLERSLSWVVQRAWKRARDEIKKTPAG